MSCLLLIDRRISWSIRIKAIALSVASSCKRQMAWQVTGRNMETLTLVLNKSLWAMNKKSSAFKWCNVSTETTELHHMRRPDDGIPPSLHACFSFIRQSCGRPSIHEERRPNVQSIDCLHPWMSGEFAPTQAPNEEQTLRSFICSITGPGIFCKPVQGFFFGTPRLWKMKLWKVFNTFHVRARWANFGSGSTMGDASWRNCEVKGECSLC